MNLDSTTLYSGTVFTLTCVVVVVPEVDTTVTVLTSWSKGGSMISSTDRVSVDTMAQQSMFHMIVYDSGIVFNPLSNMELGGDDGNYTCSAQVQDDDYVTGSNSSGTQTIAVEGQYNSVLVVKIYMSSVYHTLHSTPDLGLPLVTVRSGGSSTAGESLTVECIVETVEGVRSEDISIQWMGPDGSEPSGDNIEIGELTTDSTRDYVITTGRLVFSPLHTSDRGQYTCTGRIRADSVEVNLSNSSSLIIDVTSKYSITLFYVHSYVCCYISSVPAPNVSISLDTDGTVYQGTELVITCTVIVDPAVNTEFDVVMTWSSDPPDPMDGPYVTITNTRGSGSEFTSTVIFRPVDTTDSASYTCTTSVTSTASDTDYVTSSMECRDTVDITVEGESAQMMIHSRSECDPSLSSCRADESNCR